MKGSILALCTVITWALMSVINRYCVLKFDINVLVFTSYLIFSGGVALLLIRQQIVPGNWRSGVEYSWLYTTMQMAKSFFMISTYLYISSSETSLLINIEVVITYILAWMFFKRRPHPKEYWGILLISVGFILFIYSLPHGIRIPVAILVLLGAIASCIRSIVVEDTTQKRPETTVRQKCGISGYTMFVGGLILIIFFFLVAIIKLMLPAQPSQLFSVLKHLPSLVDVTNPATILSGCLAGFFLNSLSIYLFYAALKWAKSETFMAFRVFQPALTYGFELIAAISFAAMRPELSTKDYILGSVILLGSFLILIIPSRIQKNQRSKSFITE